jgi:hypothetical protein
MKNYLDDQKQSQGEHTRPEQRISHIPNEWRHQREQGRCDGELDEHHVDEAGSMKAWGVHHLAQRLFR